MLLPSQSAPILEEKEKINGRVNDIIQCCTFYLFKEQIWAISHSKPQKDKYWACVELKFENKKKNKNP